MSMLAVTGSSLPFLQSLVVTNKIKSPLVSMAFGRVFAQYAPLPHQPISCYKTFFADNAGVEMLKLLGEVYDVVPLDHEAVSRYAKAFYEVRCLNAYGSCQPSATGENGVYNLFHIGREFSGEEIEMIEEEGDAFTNYVSGFEQIFKAFSARCSKAA